VPGFVRQKKKAKEDATLCLNKKWNLLSPFVCLMNPAQRVACGAGFLYAQKDRVSFEK
jgi:hypothetical protein